ncbi:MAG: hypothetical protein WD069_06000 [Planctomycetales bacterium]
MTFRGFLLALPIAFAGVAIGLADENGPDQSAERGQGVVLAKSDKVNAHAVPGSLKDHWGLRLLPETVPALDEKLYRTTWIIHWEVSKAQGGSSHELLRFVPDMGDGAIVRRTAVRTNRVTGRSESTRDLPLRVDGALLELDGILHTAVIDGGNLVIDACVPAGERTWYRVHSESFAKGVRLTEHLFDFQDDPATNANGRLTVHYHRTRSWDSVVEERQVRATFVVTNDSVESRRIRLRHECRPGEETACNLPDLYFPKGSLRADLQSDDVRIYRPYKE